MRNILFSILAVCLLTISCSKEDQAVVDELLIVQYLDDNGLTGAQSTDSGLYYLINEPGTDGSPDLSHTVRVIYTGYFLDGTVFDSSGGNIVEFPLANLINGWKEGIPLFEKGGSGTLLLPSHLGYGSNPPPGIPSNSVLLFDIELVDWF